MKKGLHIDIEKETLANTDFRKVIYTGEHSQVVLMCLQPKEEIGLEVHDENDQFFRFEQGHGQCVINGEVYVLSDGTAVLVPAGAQHNIINISDSEPLKFYTLYAPPHHKDGTTHTTKAVALANEEEFDGLTTEIT